jgi:hypothetical protein
MIQKWLRRRRAWLAASVLLGFGGCIGDELFQPLLVENLALTTSLIAREFAGLFLAPFFP